MGIIEFKYDIEFFKNNIEFYFTYIGLNIMKNFMKIHWPVLWVHIVLTVDFIFGILQHFYVIEQNQYFYMYITYL